MKKVVLVETNMEMIPNTCESCSCSWIDGDNCYWCLSKNKSVEEYIAGPDRHKPFWCPIRLATEKQLNSLQKVTDEPDMKARVEAEKKAEQDEFNSKIKELEDYFKPNPLTTGV